MLLVIVIIKVLHFIQFYNFPKSTYIFLEVAGSLLNPPPSLVNAKTTIPLPWESASLQTGNMNFWSTDGFFISPWGISQGGPPWDPE